MQLAVSFTNESQYSDAIQSLRDWLLSHPEYKQHAAALEAAAQPQEAEGEEDYAKEYFFIQPKEHKSVASMFEAALTYSNDPEVSIALGIMYNMSHEYDKAVLHFQEALKGRPDDAKLWNKLGATLANGNRSGEALKAYNQ